MRKLLIDAFDAEQEWFSGDNTTVSPFSGKGLQASSGHLSPTLGLACGEDDVFIIYDEVSSRLKEHWIKCGLQGKPTLLRSLSDEVNDQHHAEFYAVTAPALAVASNLGMELKVPGLEAVKTVNSKIWSCDLRSRLGLSFGQTALGVSEIEKQLRSVLVDGPAVVKEAFGVSGRGNLLVETEDRLLSLLRWIRHQETAGISTPLVIEPFIEIQEDFSGHFEILPSGESKFLGLRRIVNLDGRYVATTAISGEALDLIQRSDYFSVAESVLDELRNNGYFGFVGVDGAIISNQSIVPILEINARMSMGLLSLLAEKKMPGMGVQALLKCKTPFHENLETIVLNIIDKAKICLSNEDHFELILLTDLARSEQTSFLDVVFLIAATRKDNLSRILFYLNSEVAQQSIKMEPSEISSLIL